MDSGCVSLVFIASTGVRLAVCVHGWLEKAQTPDFECQRTSARMVSAFVFVCFSHNASDFISMNAFQEDLTCVISENFAVHDSVMDASFL